MAGRVKQMVGAATFVRYLDRFIGRPYIYGGDGSSAAFGGFDCSGLVLEGLWATGKYTGTDMNANGICEWCKARDFPDVTKGPLMVGDLLFFGTKSKITHVAVVYLNNLMIEAGGGDSTCKKPSDSRGMVRVRPIVRRKDLVCAYRLFE